MYVIHKPSNEQHLVFVQKLSDQDWKKITIKQFAFNWKKLKGVSEIFKMNLDDQILGLIALKVIPA